MFGRVVGFREQDGVVAPALDEVAHVLQHAVGVVEFRGFETPTAC